MKRKSIYATTLIALLAIAAVLVHRVASARETTAYRFASVEKGDLQSTVSATGTLNAVRTVAVGTQVSGQVAELFVDFNDHVKKGQLLARIDPTLAQQAVTDAQANLERVQAQALQASRDERRNAELLSSGLVARSAYEATDSSADVARASVKSARVALDRARQNLAYTNIYAPIDGVVVERNVDSGQTVAASLSAPQLFLIANDLSRMRILASVGESDIASIKDGQNVRFTVPALPRQRFEGVVEQVRLQSATQENVVNYTVVISLENKEKKLLPGMTARVEFLTAEAKDVLKVANAALRFKPENAPSTQSTPNAAPSSAGGQRRARGAGAGAGAANSGRGTIYVQEGETLKAVRVRTGLTDGTFTEVRGDELRAGMKVVTGTLQPQSAESQAANPFGGAQQPQQRGGARPGGF